MVPPCSCCIHVDMHVHKYVDLNLLVRRCVRAVIGQIRKRALPRGLLLLLVTNKPCLICSTSFQSFLLSMLAARTSAARSASRIVRNFATVVDTAGVKVAAVDNGEPTSAVTFLVKAGSRYEIKPGVAHALKSFAFKVGVYYRSR